MDCEFIVIKDKPTCNEAWNKGIEQAKGDFIHLSADDIEALPGWWQAGMEWIEKGFLPAPRILNPDGSTQSCGDSDKEQNTGSHTELTRVPFFSRHQLDRCGFYPIMNGHYMGDAYVSHRGRLFGVKTVVVREMQFIHSFANVGRLDGRLGADVEEYLRVEERDIRART